MPCHQSKDGNLIVCTPSVMERRRRVVHCPVCKRKRRFVMHHEPWYGWTQTCTACGARWQDGEYCGRPNKRDWATKSLLKRLKEEWAEIRNLTKAEARALLDQHIKE